MRPVIIGLVGLIMYCTSCTKGPEAPKGSSKIELGQTTLNSISGTTANVSTSFVKAGFYTIIDHGYCWSTLENPDILGAHHSLGPVVTAYIFSYEFTGLARQTKYYIRPYASDYSNTRYGTQIEVITTEGDFPKVTTSDVTNITTTTATCGGMLTSAGEGTVTVRGVCWSTSPTPTTTGNITLDGNGIGSFISSLTSLLPNTTYYIRAYATNIAGTAYGNELTFTTLPNPVIPTITTDAATNITYTTATSGGNVTFDGYATVIARGVCWSTSPAPTLADSHTLNGSGTGTFESSLIGMKTNTQYYVMAYATNSVGTAYGNEVIFTTLNWSCGSALTINHVSGTIAPVTKTVTYGTITNIPGETSKCWITSNLGSDHQAITVDDATEASAGWYWQFNRKQGYKYDNSRTPNTIWINSLSESSDWTAARDPCTLELGSEWRIPTRTEWTNVDASGGWTNLNGPWNSALKIHAAGNLDYSGGWVSSRGSMGEYWSSTQWDATLGSCLDFYIANSIIFYYSKTYGFPLRCLRD